MYCSECGYENSDTSKFCGSCGANLQVPDFEEIRIVPDEKKRISVAGIIAVVIALLVVGAGIFTLTNSDFREAVKNKYLLLASKNYYNKEDYDNALYKFEAASDADYRSGYYMDICYKMAEGFYAEGMYEKAVEWYEYIDTKRCSFDDVEDCILKVKYKYVKENLNNYNSTTYEYLCHLKGEDYKDSEDVYEDLYSWKVSIVVNDKENDSATDLISVSSSNTIYFHVKLEGGVPRANTRLSYLLTYPDGSTDSGSWDGPVSSGNTPWVSTKTGKKGTVSVQIFDSANYKLGEKSVNVW